MNLIGKTTINPVLFYTGKISGYFSWIIFLLPGLYSIIIYHFIILGEEKFLESRFGKDYIEYKQKVRRYI